MLATQRGQSPPRADGIHRGPTQPPEVDDTQVGSPFPGRGGVPRGRGMAVEPPEGRAGAWARPRPRARPVHRTGRLHTLDAATPGCHRRTWTRRSGQVPTSPSVILTMASHGPSCWDGPRGGQDAAAPASPRTAGEAPARSCRGGPGSPLGVVRSAPALRGQEPPGAGALATAASPSQLLGRARPRGGGVTALRRPRGTAERAAASRPISCQAVQRSRP